MIGWRFACLMVLPILVGLTSGLAAHRYPDRPVLRLGSLGLILAAVAIEVLRTSVLPMSTAQLRWLGRTFGGIDLVIAGCLVWLNRAGLAHRTHRYALLATAVGVALNAAPVAVVGAMPVSQGAALRAGIPAELVFPPARGYVDSARVPTWLGILGDWMPLPGLEKVLSVGDLLLLVGLSAVVGLTCRWALGPSGRQDVVKIASDEGRVG